MVRRVNNMFEKGEPIWQKKICTNCHKPFKTMRMNKHCCSSKCHEELIKKQKDRRKKK